MIFERAAAAAKKILASPEAKLHDPVYIGRIQPRSGEVAKWEDLFIGFSEQHQVGWVTQNFERNAVEINSKTDSSRLFEGTDSLHPFVKRILGECLASLSEDDRKKVKSTQIDVRVIDEKNLSLWSKDVLTTRVHVDEQGRTVGIFIWTTRPTTSLFSGKIPASHLEKIWYGFKDVSPADFANNPGITSYSPLPDTLWRMDHALHAAPTVDAWRTWQKANPGASRVLVRVMF